jgi:hypothetical protein
MRRQHRFGTGRQLAAEIGSHQITLSIGRRARDCQHRGCKLRQVGATVSRKVSSKPGSIERLMYRIARAGMRQLKLKQWTGR